MMNENVMVIPFPERLGLRVVFDEDGKAFYCARDLLNVINCRYQVNDVITKLNDKGSKITYEIRNFPALGRKGDYNYRYISLNADNALKLLRGKSASRKIIRWFKEEVIPQVDKRSRQISDESDFPKLQGIESNVVTEDKIQSEKVREAVWHSEKSNAISDILDTIILKCVLMKRDLRQGLGII